MAGFNKLGNRDARLATSGNPNQRTNKKSEMLAQNPEDPKAIHSVGRKGYAEKARLSGVFLNVCITIKKFRQENPNSSYIDLYKELHKVYPWVFSEDPSKVYSGNVSKMINNETEWQKWYFCGQEDLIAMAEYRISQILHDEDAEDNTIIRAYDTLKKYEVNKENNININNEVVFTIEDEGWFVWSRLTSLILF